MRPNQIFAAMSQEKCEQIMGKIQSESPEALQRTVAAAAQAMKFRPQYLMKQPFNKRVSSVRRALSRLSSNQLAEELLAVYFLKCRLPLLEEWLALMELEHEEGILQADEVPCPEADELAKKVETFRGGDDDDDRELLLHVFAAQAAIDWPALDELLETDGAFE
ncbi:MAG: hypothetical protein CL908_13490 [Deltaproteobacteria bacterium]|nr:hypothetical protein [Deltaproteobacteria bacterium]